MAPRSQRKTLSLVHAMASASAVCTLRRMRGDLEPRSGPHARVSTRTRLRALIGEHLRPLAKRFVHRAIVPGPGLKKALAAAHEAHVIGREAVEWGIRSLVSTPTFLSLCAVHGERISVERVPYMFRVPRIELGSDVRISGRISIFASSDGDPVLRVGSSVFIGHGTTFALGERIEIGDYSSIGGGSYIADTEGHSHARLNVPIWEDRAGRASVAPVIIEDNVHIARCCTILKGVRIGARSVIGAGAVVRSDVAPDSIVMGNPARTASFRPSGGQ